jgi:hypothetical protein
MALYQFIAEFWGVIEIEGRDQQKTIARFKISFEYHNN